MTDRLSDLLHLEADRLPAASRQPWQVRRAAEHHRRTRRALGVVAVAGVAAALVVASLVGGPRGGTARPVPADSPSPHVTGTPMFSLATAPTLTEADWERLTGGQVSRLSSPPEVLSICLPDPRSLAGPTEAYGTAYRQPDLGRQMPLTEYVMRYADEATAVQAYAEVFGGFFGCTDPEYGDATQPFQGNVPSALRGLEDEAFVAERHSSAPVSGPGGYYQLIAARDRNVVIVIESTGWGDRPLHTIQIALMRAIPSERGKCGTIC